MKKLILITSIFTASIHAMDGNWDYSRMDQSVDTITSNVLCASGNSRITKKSLSTDETLQQIVLKLHRTQTEPVMRGLAALDVLSKQLIQTNLDDIQCALPLVSQILKTYQEKARECFHRENISTFSTENLHKNSIDALAAARLINSIKQSMACIKEKEALAVLNNLTELDYRCRQLSEMDIDTIQYGLPITSQAFKDYQNQAGKCFHRESFSILSTEKFQKSSMDALAAERLINSIKQSMACIKEKEAIAVLNNLTELDYRCKQLTEMDIGTIQYGLPITSQAFKDYQNQAGECFHRENISTLSTENFLKSRMDAFAAERRMISIEQSMELCIRKIETAAIKDYKN